MQFIDGIKITETAQLHEAGVDLKALCRLFLSIYFEQIMEHGFFNADPGLGEHPPALEVLEVLYVLASSASASWRAFGVVADITFNGSNAVRIVAEHQDVATTFVFTMPYTRKGLLRKTMTYGEMTTVSDEKLTWTH